MNLPFERQFAIGHREVGTGGAPLLVAETACAHEGSVEEAQRLVAAAAAAGADLVQVQIFRASEQVAEEHRLRPLLEKLQLSDEEWAQVFSKAREIAAPTMVFVYDLPSLRLALEFEPLALKLNSSDLVNGPLLRACAESGLPIFLGTGASTLEEITAAMDWIARCGGRRVILMHGIQDFPTALGDSRLQRIRMLKNLFGLPVGYGDHTDAGLEIAPFADLLALGLGADCLEKHITMDRAEKKTDYQAALDPEGWARYAGHMRMAAEALVDRLPLDLTPTDRRYRQFQKKYAVLREARSAGDLIGLGDVRLLRVEESSGLSGLDFEQERRHRLLRDLPAGSLVRSTDCEALM